MSRKETVDCKRETVEKGLAQLATSQRARRTYQTWDQVGGYFDGDGTVILTLAMFTAIPSIDWADSYRPQLEDVRDFLIENGLRPTKEYPCGKSEKPVWHLRLYEKGGLRTALANVLPSLNKKFGRVKATVDYFENKISGEVLLRRFNDATREGTRSGFIWDVKMPYTRAEGIAHAQSIVAKGKRASVILTTEVLDKIRELQGQRGNSQGDFIYLRGESEFDSESYFKGDGQERLLEVEFACNRRDRGWEQVSREPTPGSWEWPKGALVIGICVYNPTGFSGGKAGSVWWPSTSRAT